MQEEKCEDESHFHHVSSTVPEADLARGRKHDCHGVQHETAGQAQRRLHKMLCCFLMAITTWLKRVRWPQV
jgi:hypothetical protein